MQCGPIVRVIRHQYFWGMENYRPVTNKGKTKTIIQYLLLGITLRSTESKLRIILQTTLLLREPPWQCGSTSKSGGGTAWRSSTTSDVLLCRGQRMIAKAPRHATSSSSRERWHLYLFILEAELAVLGAPSVMFFILLTYQDSCWRADTGQEGPIPTLHAARSVTKRGRPWNTFWSAVPFW